MKKIILTMLALVFIWVFNFSILSASQINIKLWKISVIKKIPSQIPSPYKGYEQYSIKNISAVPQFLYSFSTAFTPGSAGTFNWSSVGPNFCSDKTYKIPNQTCTMSIFVDTTGFLSGNATAWLNLQYGSTGEYTVKSPKIHYKIISPNN